MSFKKDSFGIDMSGIGTPFLSPTIQNILEQQERIGRILEPTASIGAMLKQESQIARMVEPPAVLTAFIEQQNHLYSTISPIMEAFRSHQNLTAEHGFAFSKTIAESIHVSQLDMIPSSVAAALPDAFDNHAYELAAAMVRSLEACIPKYDEMSNNLARALEASLPQLNAIREMAYRLTESIPRIDSAVISIARQSVNSLDMISSSLQCGLSALAVSLENIRIPNFDHLSNSLNYISGFEEKNELLKKFGWYLISELPEDIVETIYERRDDITQDEVDALIVQYFRKDRCSALKEIVNGWVDISCFESRKDVFHQAQACHSRRTFIASTTLMAVHFEGVITDFVRERLPHPTNPAEERALDKQLRCKNALNSISELANDLPMSTMHFTDWIVCSFVLECVDAAFNANFSPINPDDCPNASRHKIAHGHATEKETEANSLRRFLFMNELYKLFFCLDKEYQLAS